MDGWVDLVGWAGVAHVSPQPALIREEELAGDSSDDEEIVALLAGQAD